MTDNNHPRFANLRTGGNMPRKRPKLTAVPWLLLCVVATGLCAVLFVIC